MYEDEHENDVSTESCYSPQERKAFYRKFLIKTKILQQNVSNQTIETLRGIMVNTDAINADNIDVEKVNHPNEVLLDSEVMSVSSDVLKRCTDILNKDTSPYNHSEFADKLLAFMLLTPDTVLEKPYWRSLSVEIAQCLSMTPLHSCLLGTLRPLEKKPVVKRKHRQRDAQVATKRPENVYCAEKSEYGVEETVLKIKVLVSQYYKNNNRPLDFFKLILNPIDLGRTIENMFHVSFLIKDGYFKMVKDNKGRFLIQPSTKEALAQAKQKGNNANIQNVMTMNAKKWQVLKEIYQLKEPMIQIETAGRL